MGGGVMRTAAKAAVLGSYRSAGALAEAAAARRAVRPPAAVVPAAATAGEVGLSVSLLSSEVDAPVASAIQRPVWEIDDWEFAGGREEELYDAFQPPPRLVFGPVATLEEAKEATSDLKEAIEKVYFASDITEGSAKGGQESTSSAVIRPAMPKHVVQAFTLLQGSPEAQDVVASLASNKNVWDAMMTDEKFMKFCKTHESILPPETKVDPEESVVENMNVDESVDSSETPLKETSESSFFSDWVHSIKLKVSELVSNISDLLQGFMGTSEATGTKATTCTSTADSFVDDHKTTMGASFLALAIAAILVILVKRGA